MPYTTLISSADLAAHLDDAGWIVCDCRHDLADTGAGRRAYTESHVPGARFVHLDADLSAPKTGRNGRHPLPDPEKFARRLGELGIDGTKQVVAYDASGGAYAARLLVRLHWPEPAVGRLSLLGRGRHRLPQPAGDGNRRPFRFALVSGLLERVVQRHVAAGCDRRRLALVTRHSSLVTQ